MLLVTPPSSAHRGDKENESAIAGPSTRSVVWVPDSELNLIHCLSTPPKPHTTPSKQRPRAAKSILKKVNTNAFLSVPATKQREITPEPSDPLVNLDYLERPVSQILDVADAGTQESLAQLIEGYNVLAARLRACVSNSTDADASWPLFQPLRKNTEAFTDAVVRDLGRALVDPLSRSSDEDENLPKSALPSPKSSPGRKKDGMTAEQVKYARDSCTTCHSVIKALSAMLSVPAIFNVFEDKQLRRMMTAVLAIPLADELPTPNSRKTCALAIWLIQVQRLPADVLRPAADRIAYALRRGIDGELGKEGKKGSANDGLKAIHDLSVHSPSIFIPAFIPLLPSILSNLLANTLALRTQACHALGGFVVGTTSLPISSVHTQIANIIDAYITTIPSPSKKSPKSPSKPTPTDAAIIRTLRTTMVSEEPEHVAQGPVWGLSVTASFIVLLGSRLCTSSKAIRLLSGVLGIGIRHKKSSIRSLACLVWRCIAWAYFQPAYPVLSDEESEVDEDEHKTRNVARESQRKLMMMVVDCQTGVATLGAFLGDSSSEENLRFGMAVLQNMAAKSGPSCLDATEVMCRLVRHTDTVVEKWDHSLLLPRDLFSPCPTSSHHLLTSEWKSLVHAVRPLFLHGPTYEDVRPLTQSELCMSWVFESLMTVWKKALWCLEMWDDAEIPDALTETWIGLLKANVEDLQDDPCAMSTFALAATRYLVDTVEDPSLSLVPNTSLKGVGPANNASSVVPDSDETIPDIQGPTTRTNGELRLRVVGGLWSAMKTIFPHSALNEAGETLLACLMRNEGALVPANARLDGSSDDDENQVRARDAWVGMCVCALSVCDMDAVKVFWGCEDGSPMSGGSSPSSKACQTKRWDWTKEFTSAVWKTSVERWRKEQLAWEGGVVLLGVPFTDRHTWNLSNEDFSLWEDLLGSTTTSALDHGHDSTAVLDLLASFVSSFQTPGASARARIADLLLSHLETPEMRDLPYNLMDMVADTMRSTYPPEPRNKQVMLWMARSLMGVIEHCPEEFCLKLLEMVGEGVGVWFVDECKVWGENDMTYDIIPLYQHILVRIQALPESLATLEIVGPILDSIFHNKKQCTQAMEAFSEYWNIAYAHVPMPASGWPESIAHALRSVGLLPPMAEIEVQDVTSPASPLLEPAFVAVVPCTPRTPVTASFSFTAITKRESLSTIPSPQRPQKVFGNFPIVPNSPVSPITRRHRTSSSSSSVRRTPLSAIQLCESPTKRRRLNSNASCRGGNKENFVAKTPIVSVAERIAEMLKSNPHSAKKRRFEDAEQEGDVLSLGASAGTPTPLKKLKGRMKPKMTKPTITKPTKPTLAARKPSSARGVSVTSNESEEERQWVEDALVPVPFPLMDVVEPEENLEMDVAVEMPRRKRELGMVLTTSLQTQPPQKREHTTSLDADTTPTVIKKIDFSKIRTVKRSVSIPAQMLSAISRSSKQLKRKRTEADLDQDREDIDADLYDLSKATPLPALQLAIAPMKKRSFSMPSSSTMQWSDSDATAVQSSSDNDPHLGQVAPHHLVSPDFKRKVFSFESRPWVGYNSKLEFEKKEKEAVEELFGSDDSLPGSDDSVVTISEEDEVDDSPTKEFVNRQLQRKASESRFFGAIPAVLAA